MGHHHHHHRCRKQPGASSRVAEEGMVRLHSRRPNSKELQLVESEGGAEERTEGRSCGGAGIIRRGMRRTDERWIWQDRRRAARRSPSHHRNSSRIRIHIHIHIRNRIPPLCPHPRPHWCQLPPPCRPHHQVRFSPSPPLLPSPLLLRLRLPTSQYSQPQQL